MRKAKCYNNKRLTGFGQKRKDTDKNMIRDMMYGLEKIEQKQSKTNKRVFKRLVKLNMLHIACFKKLFKSC